MSAADLVPLISAIVALAGAVVAGWFALKGKQVDASAARAPVDVEARRLGFDAMERSVTRLEAELNEVVTRHDERERDLLDELGGMREANRALRSEVEVQARTIASQASKIAEQTALLTEQEGRIRVLEHTVEQLRSADE